MNSNTPDADRLAAMSDAELIQEAHDRENDWLDQLASLIARKLDGKLYSMPDELREILIPNCVMPYVPIYTTARLGNWNLQVRTTPENHLVIRFVDNAGVEQKEFMLL